VDQQGLFHPVESVPASLCVRGKNEDRCREASANAVRCSLPCDLRAPATGYPSRWTVAIALIALRIFLQYWPVGCNVRRDFRIRLPPLALVASVGGTGALYAKTVVAAVVKDSI
jgi:hypothetical protein